MTNYPSIYCSNKYVNSNNQLLTLSKPRFSNFSNSQNRYRGEEALSSNCYSNSVPSNTHLIPRQIVSPYYRKLQFPCQIRSISSGFNSSPYSGTTPADRPRGAANRAVSVSSRPNIRRSSEKYQSLPLGKKNHWLTADDENTQNSHSSHNIHPAITQFASNNSTSSYSANFNVNMPHLLMWMPDLTSLPIVLENALSFLISVDLPTKPKQKTQVIPALAPEMNRKQTLVLDLDETLIHCSPFPLNAPVDLLVRFDDSNDIRVYFRPFVSLFLESVSQMFEIVVFTASTQLYADQVIKGLDPCGKLIHHKLYRNHCTECEGAYLKDLRLLGRDLQRTALADNSPISVALQPDNGIVVSSWMGDHNDRELLDLLLMLQELSVCPSIPKFLTQKYGLREWLNRLRPPYNPIP